MKKTHGQSTTRTYQSWLCMKTRCGNPRHENWRHYGGRGIKVCERWIASYIYFLADMGVRPDGKTLDRLDPDGHYAPGNCRWATRSEQARNVRPGHCYGGKSPRYLDYEGRTLRLSEWARELGIAQSTLRSRIDDYGWTIERALTTPAASVERRKLRRLLTEVEARWRAASPDARERLSFLAAETTRRLGV